MSDSSGAGHVQPESTSYDAAAGQSVPPATPTAPPATPPTPRNPLRRSRTSAVWIGVIVFAVVLVLLLIFILQNTQPVQVSYFGASGEVSLAVAMLLAAVAGVLLAAIAGSLRIWQLRRRLPRSTRR